jgi:hypothetical protein
MKRIAVLFIVLLLSAACGYAGADEIRAGFVKSASGKAFIERQQHSVPAKAGARLFQGDTLVTGPDGAMGVIFQDNGILSIGPNTRVAVEKFAFEPDSRKLSFAASIKKGTLTYASGLIGKLMPRAVTIKTPTAVCGLRGTHIAVKVDDPGDK